MLFHAILFLTLLFAEYSQALAFDQLKNIMTNGQAFVGFDEALIDFPPTFKYDVLRTIKLKRSKWRESEKKYQEGKTPLTGGEPEEEAPEAEDLDEEAEGDAASVASTYMTSTHSKPGTDNENDEDECFHASTSMQTIGSSNSKVSVSAAQAKGKAKWLALLSLIPAPASVSSAANVSRTRSKKVRTPDSSSDSRPPQPSADLPVGSDNAGKFLRTPPVIRVNSTKSSLYSGGKNEDEKGVYDSSHKQRVPSWYGYLLLAD